MKITERKKYYLLKTINYGKRYRARTVLGASKKVFKRASDAEVYADRFDARYDRLFAALVPEEEPPENFEEK